MLVVVTDVLTASAAIILRVKRRVTLGMTATEAIKMSVITTNINSLSQDYTNLDDHTSQTSTKCLYTGKNQNIKKLVYC